MSNEDTIYARVGGYEGFKKIATDILALHHANQVLQRRYGHSRKSDEELIKLVTELLCSVSGGPETYTGKNMYDAHTGMNINHEEFLEVLSDIKLALEKNHVSEVDQDRLMALNFGLKNEVLEH